VITLRNPSNRPQEFSVDVAKIFSVWHDDKDSIQKPLWEMRKGRRFLIHLAPFEVITLEAIPKG
jgi:hypothetical protein